MNSQALLRGGLLFLRFGRPLSGWNYIGFLAVAVYPNSRIVYVEYRIGPIARAILPLGLLLLPLPGWLTFGLAFLLTEALSIVVEHSLKLL
jgi:hypothetical protein